MTARHRQYAVLVSLALLCCVSTQRVAVAQPVPGDVFREYTWVPDMVTEPQAFFRVGGRLDYRTYSQYFPSEYHNDGQISLGHDLDLSAATRVEIVFEKVQSHEDTNGLAIRLNHNSWIEVEPLKGIPEPQSDYMYHAYPVARPPLAHLIPGVDNVFEVRVDSMQRWNWPQNILYGLIFRVYYEKDKLDWNAAVTGVVPEVALSEVQMLGLKTSHPGKTARVDFVGLYEDFNWEGDGVYRQWHYHFHKGKIRNHIGTATETPFQVTWSTEWLPDQHLPVQVAARVTDNTGLIYMTPEVGGLKLQRNYAVELLKPYRQPVNWVTRADSMIAWLSLHGDPSDASAVQLAWRSWSPCYARGVFVNGFKLFDREDPCYDIAEHLVEVARPGFLRRGENSVTTGKTPLIDGKMVHGMEVQWPGIMAKVRYDSPRPTGIRINDGVYAGRSHFIVDTPGAIYYYDKAGGGLSRIIDPDGNDWIGYWNDPWDSYPASAASAYRGIPNLVYGSDDGGAGHPGHDKCESRVIGTNTIRSTSHSGKWQWEWTFLDDHARLDVQKVDPTHPYWFLYEGVPGASFSPDRGYFGTDTGGPRFEKPDHFDGRMLFENWQWAYFGDTSVDRILLVAQQQSDMHVDMFSYLGSDTTGVMSPTGMVVFGFGRGDGATPLMTSPQSFYLGFLEGGVSDPDTHRLKSTAIENILN